MPALSRVGRVLFRWRSFTPLLLLAAAVLFAGQYRAIIAAEEGFLRDQFGARFDEYAARVPRFWPRLRGSANPRPWSMQRAVRKEHNPAAAWLALATLLLAWDARTEGRSPSPYPMALA